MDFEAGRARQPRTCDDALPFGFRLCGMAVDHGVAPGAGVNFDHRRAQLCRHFDLPRIGGDEQRHPHAGIVQLRDERLQRIVLADHVEAALGGEFFAALRHQAHRMRLGRERDPQHVRGRRHLEIQRLGDFRLQPRHVVVADVAAILAQMRGDAVGARLDRGERRAHRIGPRPAPRIAQGGDVVDVYAETQRRSWHAGIAQSFRTAILRSGVFAASRRLDRVSISWLEMACMWANSGTMRS